MKNSRLIRDFFLGFIKLHILHHAGKEKIYGAEFREELARHGYKVSFGTLYPIFHKLEWQGYLSAELMAVDGKIRKYYTLTESGRETLDAAKTKAKELFEELFED